MRVSFHPDAFREVEEAQAWYEERSMLAASAFLHELSLALRRLRESPQRYPVGPVGTRRVLLDRFPFTIYFRNTEDVVIIVAVAHQKRRPGYWANR
jgi:plasmid stabilization system protein ParE